MSTSPPRHRISRLYYGPRFVGFLFAFAASLFLFLEGHLRWGYLPFAAALFLIYPHLVYRWSCRSREPKHTELQALLVDALLVGAWAALTGFNLGITFALLCGVCLNNAINRGLPGVWKTCVFFAAGALAASAAAGFSFAPLESLNATAVALLGVLLYMLNVGVVFHSQNALLLRVKNDAQRKKKVFEALASVGMARRKSDTEDELVSRSLAHVHRVLPRECGVGVVLREAARPTTVHYAGFRRIDDGSRAWLLQRLAEDQPPSTMEFTRADGSRTGFILMPMGSVGGGREGFFVMRANALSEADRSMAALFLQQLAAALQNRALTQRLIALANTDPLTGLHNRTSLAERLALAMELKERCPEADFTVIVADVNGLKHVNDVHGHELGDQLIIAAARVLRESCRESDLVCRIGGDEFVILCPSMRQEDCVHLVERLATGFARASVTTAGPDGRLLRLPLRVSIGFADSREFPPAEVFREADRRMYANKQAFYAAGVR